MPQDKTWKEIYKERRLLEQWNSRCFLTPFLLPNADYVPKQILFK